MADQQQLVCMAEHTPCTCKGDVHGTVQCRVKHLLLRRLVEVQRIDETIVCAGNIDLPIWQLQF
jgi:hypothetical protein